MKTADIILIGGIICCALVLVYGIVSEIPNVMRPIAAALGGGL